MLQFIFVRSKIIINSSNVYFIKISDHLLCEIILSLKFKCPNSYGLLNPEDCKSIIEHVLSLNL